MSKSIYIPSKFGRYSMSRCCCYHLLSLIIFLLSGRVHELSGLRIVDASIMPQVTNGNLNSPVTMMAEKIADAIRGLPPLPPSSAPYWKPQHPDRQRDGEPVRKCN